MLTKHKQSATQRFFPFVSLSHFLHTHNHHIIIKSIVEHFPLKFIHFTSHFLCTPGSPARSLVYFAYIVPLEFNNIRSYTNFLCFFCKTLLIQHLSLFCNTPSIPYFPSCAKFHSIPHALFFLSPLPFVVVACHCNVYMPYYCRNMLLFYYVFSISLLLFTCHHHQGMA